MSNGVLIIGGGVIGLSVAVVLAEAGLRVRMVTAEPADERYSRSSLTAAAFWYPFHVGGPYDERWAEATFDHLVNLSKSGGAGVRVEVGIELFEALNLRDRWLHDIWWRRIPGVDFALLDGDDPRVPPGFSCAASFRVPVVHMPTYLEYLVGRAEAAGVRREVRTIRFVDEILNEADAVIVCAGLGSGRVVLDPTLQSCQGQVVSVKEVDFEHLIFVTTGEKYQDEPLYIVPRRGHDIVLGGTTVDDETDLNPDPVVTRRILHRCRSLYPELEQAAVLGEGFGRVGLRPQREGGIRLEREDVQGTPVVHNYGHGGAGVTLSWGCARRVLELLGGQPA